MIDLAWLTLTDEFGRDVIVPINDILRVKQDPDGTGSILTFRNGSDLEINEDATTVAASIQAFWDALIAAITP